MASETASQLTADRPPTPSDGDGDARALAAAGHQCLVREVNEEIRRLGNGWDDNLTWVMICECGGPKCFETIALTIAAYEVVRRFPTRFVVVPGHELPGLDRTIEEHDGYLVVEKIGVGATTAIRSDPRRDRRAMSAAARV